ncbi:MAG: GHKL domain-containing protein [Clostridia bacterium]|nr:GHKL domain-containing protein [Clostridia bacterium]
MLLDTFAIKRDWFSLPFYGIGIILLAVLMNISNAVFGMGALNAFGMISACFGVSFFYKSGTISRVVLSVLYFAFLALMEIIVLYILILTLKISAEQIVEIPSYRYMGIVLSKLLTFMVVKIVNLKFKNISVMPKSSYRILFTVMFLITVLTTFILFRFSLVIREGYLYNLSLLSAFGMLFSTFFSLYLYEHLTKQAYELYNKQERENRLKSQVNHLEEMLVAQNQLKRFRHDIDNLMIGLQAYIDKRDFEGLSRYIHNLKGGIARYSTVSETGNTALDALLNVKIAVAKGKGIHIITKIQIPQSIHIDDADICVIFGNALDNAIEACINSKRDDAEIEIVMMYQDKKVFCKITNTAPVKKNYLFKTSKADKTNHGFGLENIKNILAKYNTVPSIEYVEDKFILKFILFT